MAKYSIVKNFYASDKWINFRLLLISQRGNKCERCKKIIVRSIEIIGHHKEELTPENVSDYDISLNPDKVELICRSCHDEEHNRFGHKVKHNVYIVYGAPLSGKKTFVNQSITRGDMVIDIDRLYEAISMLPSYDKPNNLFSNVINIHNALIDNVKTRYGKWNDCYLVGGYADKYKREKMANDLGAELIFCDTSKEECLNRLSIDEERKYRRDEWREFIEKWFDNHS